MKSATAKQVKCTLKIERLAEMNGGRRDGSVIKIPLDIPADALRSLKAAFKGSGIYTVYIK